MSNNISTNDEADCGEVKEPKYTPDSTIRDSELMIGDDGPYNLTHEEMKALEKAR